MFTRVTINGVVYSANPCYGSLGLSKQEWAYVNMGQEKPIPCQLLCILNIPEDPIEDIVLSGSIIDEKGIYFLAHTSHTGLEDVGTPSYAMETDVVHNDEGTLAHADQKLIHRLSKSHEKSPGEWLPSTLEHKPSCLLVDAKSIVGPCIAIPDILADSEMDFFVLREVKAWHNLFIEEAKMASSKPRTKRRRIN